MGTMSFRLKSYFVDLLKCLNSLNYYIILFSLINLSVCIYEDQIGKFDWRQSYVGKIKFAQFDTVSTAKRIIVATEENVLAALNLKTGQVVWRQVLDTASSGNIQLLHVSERVYTVSGDNPYLVRTWDSNTGVLLWEWALTLQDDSNADLSHWWVQNGLLVHLVPIYGSHVEVTMYNILSGQNRGSTSRLPAVWNNAGCILTKPYYTCLTGEPGSQMIISLDVSSEAVQMISRSVSHYIGTDRQDAILRPLDGVNVVPGFVINGDKLIIIKQNDFELVKITLVDNDASVSITESVNGPIVLQMWNDNKNGLLFKAHSVSTSQEVSEIKSTDSATSIPGPKLLASVCTKSAKEQHVCRILVNGQDGSANLLQQAGRTLWTREESLTKIVTAKFVDLPVSDLDAAIESEFDQKEGSIWAAFSRRIQTQLQQLKNFQQSWSGSSSPGKGSAQSQSLVRDYFNLHKVIVLVTDAGTIFGMDNLSGDILWRRYLPFLNAEGATIYTRRSARHPPHDAYVTVVAKYKGTGNGLLVSFNPITGGLLGEKILELDYKLLQSAMLHTPDAEHLRALLLLDKDENVQVLPLSAASLVQNMYMFVAEKNTATVQGYALKYDGKNVNALKTWSVNLGGSPDSGHTIIRIVPKSPDERVHSPGKVMGDRSVLYKYLNPNLVLFITEGPDPIHKEVATATCMDVVSGAVVFAQSHRRARATPHAVHTDNLIAYVTYNDKQRRSEIATVELYEGRERWLLPGAEFSSLSVDRAPLAERQSYIIPAAVTAAAVTATKRAITDKHLLMALSSGAIVEMPWVYLDPRRPTSPTAEQREEGLVPYAPELPIPAEAILNYNLTLHRLNKLFPAPAGLESTCLVLATGLDLFYTRVAPSKTFDLLKDDFDYYIISIVLAGLIVATYSTKYLAARKILKQGWK